MTPTAPAPTGNFPAATPGPGATGRALRVCIVAEHASTRLGGEAILPFHYFRILRRRGVDAWLIVHERTRAELEEAFAGDLERVRFVRDQPLQRLFFRLGRLLPRRMAEATFGLANQMLTQHAQRSVVRGLRTSATVLHQPIPVSPRFPSLLAGLGAPLVVGPLNGGMDYPPAFRAQESPVSRAAIALGRSLSTLGNALLPGKRHAALILVANQRTRAALPGGIRGRVVLMAENAVDLKGWSAPAADTASSPDHEQPGHFLFLGRLVDWKALDLVLYAMALAPGTTLEVVGDGPMRHPWSTLAASLGLSHRVTFSGWRTQAECAQRLAGCRALVLPSLYECGGAVVLEAMAVGRAVIATAWGGPAEYLDSSCGLLLPPTSRQALIAGFADAMTLLSQEPRLAHALGQAGRQRVRRHFDWERKVDAITDLYRSVLPGGSEAP